MPRFVNMHTWLTDVMPGTFTLVFSNLLPMFTETETGSGVSGGRAGRSCRGGRGARGGRLGRGETVTLTSTSEDLRLRCLPAQGVTGRVGGLTTGDQGSWQAALPKGQ